MADSERPLQVKVLIDENDIERQVIDAIVESAIGQQIKGAIEGQVEKLKRDGYGSLQTAVNKVVEDQVKAVTFQIVSKEWKEAIEEKVRAALTEEQVSKVVSKVMAQAAHGRY